MTKFTLLFLLLTCGYLYPQFADSLNIQKGDSLSISTADSTRDTIKSISNYIRLTGYNIKSSLLSENSNVLTQEIINKTEFRYTTDLLRYLPTAFIIESGTYGKYNDISFYGTDPGNMSVMQDGMPADNYNSFFDMYNIPVQGIDNIELVPLVRGFLFSNTDNAVTLNILSKDFIEKLPFTRVRYYQGNYGEADIDFIFNTLISKNINAFVELHNGKADNRYQNSFASVWNGKIRLKYIADKFNLTASYILTDVNKGLNGGVDLDSILSYNKVPEDVLYDEVLAPVFFTWTSAHQLNHSASITADYRPDSVLRSTVNVFYRFYKDEVFNIFDDSSEYYKNHINYYGLKFTQELNTTYLKAKLFTTLENSVYNSVSISYNQSKITNRMSIGGIMTFGNSKIIVPSVFFKYLAIRKEDNSPVFYGADIKFNVSEDFSIYGGYSESSHSKNNIESGVKYKSKDLSASLSYFHRSEESVNSMFNMYPQFGYYPIGYSSSKVSGINFSNYLKYWKISLENNMNFMNKGDGRFFSTVPEYFSVTGIFYNDILFENNLELRTGFNWYTFGSRFTVEVMTGNTYRLDFIFSGTIQKAATVFLTVENIFNKRYFMQAYYPMPGTSLRFGVAWDLFN